MKNKKYLLIGMGILLIGVSLYVLFNRNIIIFRLLNFDIPVPEINNHNWFVDLIRSFGADLCWIVSLTLILQFIFNFEDRKVFILILTSLLGIVLEIFQLLGITTGTFDFWDIFIYLTGSIGTTVLIYRNLNKIKER